MYSAPLDESVAAGLHDMHRSRQFPSLLNRHDRTVLHRQTVRSALWLCSSAGTGAHLPLPSPMQGYSLGTFSGTRNSGFEEPSSPNLRTPI